MIKRPLCIICLGVMIILLLIDVSGLSDKWKSKTHQLLQEKAEESIACQVEGTVRYYERKQKSIYIYLEETILNVQSEQYFLKETIIKYSGNQGFAIGNLVQIKGELESLPKATNPGQFDARSFYNARNIYFFIKGEELIITDAKYNWIKGTLYQLREEFCERINTLVPQDGGILSTMITGEKTFLEEDIKIRYQMSGLMHIVAISGLHFSVLGIGCHRRLTKMGLNFYFSSVLAIAIMSAYGAMTGTNSVSISRALAMFMIYIIGRIIGRTYDMLSALSLSGILILMQYPGYLYDSSFQLSFGAVLAIGIVYPLLQGNRQSDNKDGKRLRVGREIMKGLIAGFAIWLVTLPMLLSSYYEVSVYGLLLNLIVVPTSTVVLLSGIIGGTASFLNIVVGKILVLPAAGLLCLYDYLGQLAQRLPYPTIILGKPLLWKGVCYYVVLVIFLLGIHYWKKAEEKNKMEFKTAMVVIAMGVLLTCFLGIRGHDKLAIAILDVGQGDGIVISTPSGNHYLVDGGSSSVNEVGKYRIMPYLKSQGIQKLEAIMITHPDKDHINGVLEIFLNIINRQTSIRVKKCILPRWMQKHQASQEIIMIANEANVEVEYVKAGDRIEDGEVIFGILHPQDKEYEENTNEGSLTFMLEYQKFNGLFTGDLCDDGEVAVTQQIEESEFLKVSHHGSKNSTFEPFLEKARPDVSVISCGERNLYGHPHQELMERLEDIDGNIYLTKDSGAIMIRTGGEDIMEVEKFVEN